MSSLPFSFVDLAFVAILVISGVLAYLRGFVREVLAVVAWVGAIFVALYGFTPLQPYARTYIENRMIADMVTGVVLFVAALAILTIIAHLISRTVRESSASGFDRSLGFVFGVLRGVVLVTLLYLSAAWFWGRDNLPQPIREARTYPLIDGAAEILLALAPKEARASAAAATGVGERRPDPKQNERALRGLIQPQPNVTPPGSEQATKPQEGYSPSERNEMQRLIESTQ